MLFASRLTIWPAVLNTLLWLSQLLDATLADLYTHPLHLPLYNTP
uniref:Uncharacterized protein n=1 Tax=Phakopsora pachyrhizi TaxID=170000 RepID=A0A0S1MIA4_PHAPC